MCGVINALKVQTTRRGDLMARFNLEDLEGVAEVIVFPDCYRDSSETLDSDEPILLSGTIDPGEEGVVVKAEKIVLLSGAAKKLGRGLLIRLPAEGKSREWMRAHLIDLKEILEDHRGTIPLSLQFDFDGRVETRRYQHFGVDPSGEMMQRVESLLGERSVRLE